MRGIVTTKNEKIGLETVYRSLKLFVPVGKPKCKTEEIILKIEELEAMRLKDIKGLKQFRRGKENDGAAFTL